MGQLIITTAIADRHVSNPASLITPTLNSETNNLESMIQSDLC